MAGGSAAAGAVVVASVGAGVAPVPSVVAAPSPAGAAVVEEAGGAEGAGDPPPSPHAAAARAAAATKVVMRRTGGTLVRLPRNRRRDGAGSGRHPGSGAPRAVPEPRALGPSSTRGAPAHDGEVGAVGDEAVGSGHRFDGAAQLHERDVHDRAASLADEMVVAA